MTFLPGVPVEHVSRRLSEAGGDELSSGKFAHPESSAALAVNAFGWFIPRPQLFPRLPDTGGLGAVRQVEVEYGARFPWSGGRHPWLDAAIITETHLIGVESKRFEPFRDAKRPQFSPAYDTPAWGANMERYDRLRRDLANGAVTYACLDGAQLVKHAYGLVTEAKRQGRSPHLYYIFAEPEMRGGKTITPTQHLQHRSEVVDFASRVAGDEVGFAACSYREWLVSWTGECHEHARNVEQAFAP